MPSTTTPLLPPLHAQVVRLLELGVPQMAGITESELRAAVDQVAVDGHARTDPALLVIHPSKVPPSALAPLLRHRGKPGFVVVDMPDLDDFAPIGGVDIPDRSVYLLAGPHRGDHLANWSPNEALPAIVEAGRTPLTVHEGIMWLLQQPDLLERNRCFMTIGSRLRKASGALDARTPAIWISNGTGRDGAGNRHAPKVGWCWAGNRHTWLGFASAAGRLPG